MSIQTDLQAATIAIQSARNDVAHWQRRRLRVRLYLTQAQAEVATATRVLMARSEAGTNEVARRAYAERETAADREGIIEIENELADIELSLITAQAILDTALDRRRYLESIIRLMVEHATDLIQAAYADDPAPNGSGDYSEDNPPF